MKPQAALLAAVCGALLGCAGSPRRHALDYVVLPNAASEQTADPRAKEDAGREYPIYGDHPPPRVDAPGVECSPGLIGTRCELGLLKDEVPLAEQEPLPPDGKVFQQPLPLPGEG